MGKTFNVIAAATVGFVAGILLAPKSGKETREDIKAKAGEAKEYASKKATQTKGALKASSETVGEAARNVGHEASEFAGHAKESAGKLAQEARRTAHAVKDDVTSSFK